MHADLANASGGIPMREVVMHVANYPDTFGTIDWSCKVETGGLGYVHIYI